MALVEFCPLQGFKAAQDSLAVLANRWRGVDLPALTSPTFPNPPPIHPLTHPPNVLLLIPPLSTSTSRPPSETASQSVSQYVRPSVCLGVWLIFFLRAIKSTKYWNLESKVPSRMKARMVPQLNFTWNIIFIRNEIRIHDFLYWCGCWWEAQWICSFSLIKLTRKSVIPYSWLCSYTCIHPIFVI